MNGASADDCAKTSRAPRRSRTRTMGSSQSFLFWRRNIQTSPASESLPIEVANPSLDSSEQALELLARLARAFALDPVTLLRGPAPPQRVAPGQTRNEAVRRDDEVVKE